MDITRYTNKVDAKVANDRKKEQNRQDAERRKYESLAAELDALRERLDSILEVGKYCEKNGIDVANKYASRNHGYGELSYSFVTDGFYHHVGFYKRGERSPITGLAIKNGGACGPWDFHYGGEDHTTFYWKHEDHKRYPGITHEPPNAHALRDMENFIKEFPLFEAAFYSWVDSLA